MTFGSLFSGIGGMDLGLERAGMQCKWQVEIDEFCTRVLEKHWPHVPRLADIRDCHILPQVDLIAGGFPCQDISTAGKGAGIEGSRSGLWSEMCRLIRTLRPSWVLVENVPALRTRGADRVLGELEAAGYTTWPLVVGARHVGAPHRRDRVWVMGLANSGSHGVRLESRRGSGPGREGAAVARADGVAHAHGLGREGERSGRLFHGEREAQWYDTHGRYRWPARPGEAQHSWEEPRTVESPVGRSVDGVSRRLALRALGNACVPQVAEVIGQAILMRECERND